jgi:hypothetical protein
VSSPTETRPRLKLDPDLADGQHWTIGEPDAGLLELIRMWMASSQPGDSFTIALVMMTDAEVAALPDI